MYAPVPTGSGFIRGFRTSVNVFRAAEVAIARARTHARTHTVELWSRQVAFSSDGLF